MKMLIMIFAWMPTAFAQSAEAPDAVTSPALVRKTEPEYTPEARAKGIEGVINLYAEVTKDGAAVNVRVVKSLDPGLDARAVQAVKSWRFLPGKRAGKPVTVAAIIEVRFQLPRYPVLPSSAPRPEVPLPEEKNSCWPSVFGSGVIFPGICIE